MTGDEATAPQTPPGGEQSSPGGKAGRPRRAAVRLSRVDAERLARGEISSPEEALRGDAGRSGAGRAAPVAPKDANERRLLEERPPHFGAL